MRVDTSHRNEDPTLSENDFWSATEYLVREFSALPGVLSLVLCGSLAKGDAIPGWSDIDFIVFADKGVIDLKFLQTASDILSVPVCRRIGIGIDFCDLNEFRQTLKIGGRPYMMTFEVGVYGHRKWGIDPWKGIGYGEREKSLVEFERRLLIASELHNWQRALAALDFHHENAIRDAGFLSAKALLRLLQLETGPNLEQPITAAGSFERLSRNRQDHPALPAFSCALAFRRAPHKARTGDELSHLLRFFALALNGYPIRLTPEV